MAQGAVALQVAYTDDESVASGAGALRHATAKELREN
jgi:hypothetical protein